jgi:hypothetical protein
MSALPAGLARLDLVPKLTGEVGQPLVVLAWWASAFRALDDPAIRELLLWLPRQSGKSQWLATAAITELLLRPGSYTLYVAAGLDQAAAVYHRKLRRPLERGPGRPARPAAERLRRQRDGNRVRQRAYRARRRGLAERPAPVA